jgi:hypothetical protein
MNKPITLQMQMNIAEVSASDASYVCESYVIGACFSMSMPVWHATSVRLGPRAYKAKPKSNIEAAFEAAETRKRVRRRLSKTLDYLATR